MSQSSFLRSSSSDRRSHGTSRRQPRRSDVLRRAVVEMLESRQLLSAVDVFAATADRAVRTDGSMPFVGDPTIRVGDNGNNTTEQVMIIPFALPSQSGTLTDASLTAYLASLTNAGSINGGVDIYGLGWRSASTVLTGDYFVGAYGTDNTDATPIQTNFATNATSPGALTTSSSANTALVNYINAQIANGAQPGDYIFIRLNAQVSQATSRFWTFSSADNSTSSQRPKLTLTYGSVPAAPSSLSASAVSSSQINLSWTDNSSDETGFEIDRATNSTFTSGLVTNTVGANVTTYNATGLNPSTTYYFRVRATNSSGDSANSNTANATTQSTGATIRYVGADPDNNGDGSQPNPYGTLNAAYQASNQGDEIYVLTGTYGYQTINPRAAAAGWTQNVTIRPAPGASVVLGGAEVKAPHITIQDLQLNGFVAARAQIDGTNADYFNLLNCTIYGGVSINVSNAVVEDNNLLGSSNVDGLVLFGTRYHATNIVVRNNLIRDYVYPGGGQHVDGMQLNNVSNVLISRNRILDSGNSLGIILSPDAGPVHDVLFENNMVSKDPNATSFRLLDARDRGHGNYNLTFINNTFDGSIIVGSGQGLGTNVVRNNIIGKFSILNGQVPVHDHNYIGEITGTSLHSTEVLGNMPKFVDSPNVDLHLVLVSGQPVDGSNNPIDLSFGSSTGAPLIDFDGDTRDLNDLWVGADEE